MLIVDVEPPVASRLMASLKELGCGCASIDSANTLSFLTGHRVSGVVLNVGIDKPGAGIELLHLIRRAHPTLCILATSLNSSEQLVLSSFRAGATDFLPPPVVGIDVLRRVKKHVAAAGVATPVPSMVGESDEMTTIRKTILRVASSDSNVLITGETGTGKELVAELIHARSSRASQPLACINCAAIPDTLLESELFGFERGAFTGAHLSRAGKIESANGGTVFFDEIGELSPYAQARLLRVIEEKKVYRLGGRKPIDLNIRVVAATNRDLDTLAMEDKFRRDLYFRLNIGRIHLPPLRERKRDIPVLVDYYVSQLNEQFGAKVEGIQPEVMEHLLTYTWPGNVRELKNLLEAVFISQRTSRITFVDLPEWFRKKHPLVPRAASESDRLLSALYATNWNKSEAAGRLKWSRMTLYRKMAKYGLQKPDDKES